MCSMMTIALVVAVLPSRHVQSIFLSQQEMAALEASAGTANSPAADQQTGGENAFVRALKAPFKAIGRLFGRGKKDDNKLHRLKEKDVERFESAKVTRVTDATSQPPGSERQVNDPNGQVSAAEHLDRGRTLLSQGHLNEAIEELSLATSLDPKLAIAHNLLGVAYQGKGMPDMAQRAFETSLKLDKNNAQTLNNLGYLLYLNGDYRGALDRLKKAARRAPDDTRVLNNLGLAQSRLGKFDDAYKSFARAGGEIDGRLNIANRLELAGRSDEALKYYEEARKKAEAQSNSDPKALAITVAMEIKNGRVSYASVVNHRPGFEAYEGSALRIARARRYPANKNGPESVVIRITPAPAS
jgi:Flp pilus assembly protein TadD